MLSTDTRILNNLTIAAMSAETLIKSGSGVVTKNEGGRAKASNGSASTSELFLGVAQTEIVRPTVGKRVEQVTAPTGGGPVTLSRTPVGGAAAVRAVQSNLAINVAGQAGTPASGEVQVVGAVVTFNAAEAGKVFNVTYTYSLTVEESTALFGSGIAGISSSAATHTLSVITEGEVYTDQFDSGAKWAEENIADICVLASGIFGRGSNGAPCAKVRVLHVPTSENPYLGLLLV